MQTIKRLLESKCNVRAYSPRYLVRSRDYCKKFQSPAKSHKKLLKRDLRYLVSFAELRLMIPKIEASKRKAFSDDVWTGCIERRKFTTRMLKIINDASKCENAWDNVLVPFSFSKAEYVVLPTTYKALQWIRRYLGKHDFVIFNANYDFCATDMYTGNTSAMTLAESSTAACRTKHHKVKFHSVRKIRDNNQTVLNCAGTTHQKTNLMRGAVDENTLIREEKTITTLH